MQDIKTLKANLDASVAALVKSIDNANAAFPDYGHKWGPWIVWYGGNESEPDKVDNYQIVNVYRRLPTADHWLVTEAGKIDWMHDGSANDVMAYRVRIEPETD